MYKNTNTIGCEEANQQGNYIYGCESLGDPLANSKNQISFEISDNWPL